MRQLEKRIQKAETNATSQLKELQKEKFSCYQDAVNAISKLSKKLKYHNVENIQINEKTFFNKTPNQEYFSQISASLFKNEPAINLEIQSAGRFILATNILDENILTPDAMIAEYKA